MTFVIDAFRTSFQAVFLTGAFSQDIQEIEAKEFLIATVKNIVVLLLFFTILLVLSHIFLQQPSLQELAKENNLPSSYPPSLFTPWAKLYFPFVWFLYIALAGGIRYFSLLVLGETERSFYKAVAISAYSTIPLMLSGLALNIYSNISPFYQDKDISKLKTQLAVFIFLFLIFFLWEARIYVILARNAFAQNNGRAFLSWLFPVMVLLFLTFGYAYGMAFAGVVR